MRVGNFIYVIRYGERDVKIGISVAPVARLKQLKGGGAVHVVHRWYRPEGDARRLEAVAHRLLASWRHRISGQKERFAISERSAKQAVELAMLLEQDNRASEALIHAERAAAAAHLVAAQPLPAVSEQNRHIGYVRRATAGEASAECDFLTGLGVEVAAIYVDVGKPGAGLRAARKACAAGDALVIAAADRIDGEARAALAAAGAVVRELIARRVEA